MAARTVADEVLEHLPGISRKRGADLGILLPAFSMLPVDWAEEHVYARHEPEARRLLMGRDEEDWPSVALAFSIEEGRSYAIWTQDKDFEVTRLPTLTTGAILDILEGHLS